MINLDLSYKLVDPKFEDKAPSQIYIISRVFKKQKKLFIFSHRYMGFK